MAATVLHTLAIHPLRGFPGPVVAAYSRVPYWVACLRGNQVRWLQRLHSRYGPVVRYGPNDLSYTDERAWQDIFGHKKGRAENPKDKRFFGPSKNGVESMVTADIESHAKVRRILSVAFSERALRKQEPLFQKYADLMIDSIRQTIAKDPTAPLDMVRFMNFTTFDLMADLAFGEPLGLLERNEYTQWVEMIFKSIAVLPVVQITQYYPILKTLFEWLEPRSVADIRLAHFRHSTDRVDRRLSRGSNKPDIWNLVISGDGGSPLSLAEMHSNAEIFMTAGTETTATLLSGLCYLLLAHPDKMETLVKEVRGSFDSDAEISLDRLSGLGYLNACLEEGLRLYPPVPSSIPRVTPEGGNIILDEWVAPGVSPAQGLPLSGRTSVPCGHPISSLGSRPVYLCSSSRRTAPPQISETPTRSLLNDGWAIQTTRVTGAMR